jgi:hypothetical protein
MWLPSFFMILADIRAVLAKLYRKMIYITKVY